jgi:hypothetical protein
MIESLRVGGKTNMPREIGLYVVYDMRGNASVCLAVDESSAGAGSQNGCTVVKLGSVTLEKGENVITSDDMNGKADAARIGRHLVSAIATRLKTDYCRFKFEHLRSELADLLRGVFR